MSPKAKLSERVRANSEAAPWVVEEIKKLEAQLEAADHSAPNTSLPDWPEVNEQDELSSVLAMRRTILLLRSHSIWHLEGALRAHRGGNDHGSWCELFEAVVAHDEAEELADKLSGIRTHIKSRWFGYGNPSGPLMLGHDHWK